ncbi:hypothetical protein FCULG_00010113 [Fusarium culmorum]|uniref:Uncharacterized protein n=1 Tax=Fusarium culmorum TaxID=5516 RepID=A0A2T4GD19_FUSCU|nr:hypothetical protein FCULG_00010113 [Fusarium culmorum]
MSNDPPTAFPWECRDKEDQAKEEFTHPHRRVNQSLADENMRLKRILRENGISWSSVSLNHMQQSNPLKRKTLRYEISHPDRGPFVPLTPENLSDKEKAQGNQIAIHFLATCKALHVEGTRFLWESNHFTFTTPRAVRIFADLPAKFRQGITHVNFRIIARYYDDQPARRHKLDRCYHSDLKKDHHLKVQQRSTESPLVRGGFRCYTWNQVVDFLEGFVHPSIRVTETGSYHDQKCYRLWLPSDSTSGAELHDICSHEFGCTLNELQVTGMPFDDTGLKASVELSGMLKDEGLYLDGPASYMARSKYLQRLRGKKWCARVIRAWKPDDDEDSEEDEDTFHSHSHRDEETVIWKRVPISRDVEKRDWIQFSRSSGYEIGGVDWDDDEEGICPCCGDSHSGTSILEYLMDEE